MIKDSVSNESSVTLLKAEPLSVAEVNQYGVGHVNIYAADDTSESYYRGAYDQNGYGGMQYYSSETCGNVNHNLVYDGCTTDYTQSEVKYAVDAWAQAQAPAANEARLIELADLKNNLGCVLDTSATSEAYLPSSSTPSWIYNSDYGY